MSRFLFWSDLHTEFSTFTLPDVHDIDAVLLGGDTGVGDAHLDMLYTIWKTYQVPVVSIRGNHEFYNCIWQDQIEKDNIRLAQWHEAGIPIHVLDPGFIDIAGTRIIGATLWTDMMVMGEGGMAEAMVGRALNDYRIIGWREGQKVRKLTTKDTRIKHMEDKNFIFDTLDKPFDGPKLVMTHHIPTPLCVDKAYKGSLINAGFASDLTYQMMGSDADQWFYGHTHTSNDTELSRDDGKILRVRSNIRGYPHEWSGGTFDPNFVIET